MTFPPLGEYRICPIMAADPIPLDWQLACIVATHKVSFGG